MASHRSLAFDACENLWLHGPRLFSLSSPVKDFKDPHPFQSPSAAPVHSSAASSPPFRFVQQNMIWEIDGLDGLDELDTINISNNNLKALQNLSHLKKLRTLLATNNRLSSVEAIAHAADIKSLSVLDLSNNR